MRNTPADGMVTGIGSVNGARFGAERRARVVMAYDYTVLAGTQGMRNHQKTDRLLGIALQQRAAGGAVRRRRRRPAGRHRHAHRRRPARARPSPASRALSGQVPVVGIVAGRCFAGNAALLGCCDVIIATRGSQHRHGRPGDDRRRRPGRRSRPRRSGPSGVQSRQRRDRRAGRRRGRRRWPRRRHYLSFFQGALPTWERGRPARAARRRAGEPRCASTTCARVMRAAGRQRLAARTARRLRRRHRHRAGAHRGPAGRRARQQPGAPRRRDRRRRRRQGRALHAAVRCARPADRRRWSTRPASWSARRSRRRAQVRHASRMFVAAAHLRVPFFSVVLRKGYGLGAHGA